MDVLTQADEETADGSFSLLRRTGWKIWRHDDVLRRLTPSLWRGIGDQKLFEMAAGLGRQVRSSDLNGGSMVGFAQSLAGGTGDDRVAPWKAAWSLATRTGETPSWALPRRSTASDGRRGQIGGAARVCADRRNGHQRLQQPNRLRSDWNEGTRIHDDSAVVARGIVETCEADFDEACDGAKPMRKRSNDFCRSVR